MKRKYNLLKIKSKKSYSTRELAESLRVHIQTVRSWNKEGLEAIDPESKRPLFLGDTVKLFLKKLQDSRKVKLLPDQFFCLRCKKAVTPAKVLPVNRNILIGKEKISLSLTAYCPFCECKLSRFSTDSEYRELKNIQDDSMTKKVINTESSSPFNHSHSNK